MQEKNRKRILIVDDNEGDQQVLSKAFQGAGFAAFATWSGHEALDRARSDKFDAIVVDDYLPDLHLTDFLARLGRLPSRPRVVVMQDQPPTRADRRRYEGLGALGVADKRAPDGVVQVVLAACARRIARSASRTRAGLSQAGGPGAL